MLRFWSVQCSRALWPALYASAAATFVACAVRETCGHSCGLCCTVYTRGVHCCNSLSFARYARKQFTCGCSGAGTHTSASASAQTRDHTKLARAHAESATCWCGLRGIYELRLHFWGQLIGTLFEYTPYQLLLLSILLLFFLRAHTIGICIGHSILLVPSSA